MNVCLYVIDELKNYWTDLNKKYVIGFVIDQERFIRRDI